MNEKDLKLPLVSVLIPAFNHEKFVTRAIKSVINQSYNNMELIIIDDGSVDGTSDEIEKELSSLHFKSVYIKQKNAGINNTLNKMVNIANGEYLKLLASDDELHPKAISRLVSFALLSNHKFDLIFGDCLDGHVGHEKNPWQHVEYLDRIPKKKM